jgi:hypothetical protein
MIKYKILLVDHFNHNGPYHGTVIKVADKFVIKVNIKRYRFMQL